MLNDDLSVGAYGRVSDDKPSKEGPIASQMEKVLERIASDGLKLTPVIDWLFPAARFAWRRQSPRDY